MRKTKKWMEAREKCWAECTEVEERGMRRLREEKDTGGERKEVFRGESEETQMQSSLGPRPIRPLS